MGISLPFFVQYVLKEHIELYKIFKFRVNWANIEQDTAIQKLKNLLTNLDCEQSLFLSSVPGHARERASSGEAARREKRGRQPEKKK